MRRLLLIVALLAAGVSGVEAADPPALTEIEKLKVENLTLKAQLARAIADADACRGELGPTRTKLNQLVVQAEVDRLASEIDAAHPGFRVNRQTWTLEPAPATPPPPGPRP